VSVAAGDYVSAGRVMCEFDTESFRLEAEKIKADLAIVEIEKGRALAERDQTARQICDGKIRQLQAKLKIIDRKIKLATIRAPFDGIVTQGDLGRRIGDVLAQGTSLFELSGEAGWLLELHVPEGDVKHISAGLGGEFLSNASPEAPGKFRTTKVFPSARQEENGNIYVAQARVESSRYPMRPGMEGSAKITAGRRPVWWVLSHKIVDSVRMRMSK